MKRPRMDKGYDKGFKGKDGCGEWVVLLVDLGDS